MNETSVPKEDRDPKLYENIKNNDMNYILHQAMNALRTLRDNNLHFTHPDDYKDVVNKMKFSDSVIRQFIGEMWDTMLDEETIDKDRIFSITDNHKLLVTKGSSQEFYDLYKSHCDNNGNKKMSRINFINELSNLGFYEKKTTYRTIDQDKTDKPHKKKAFFIELNVDNVFKNGDKIQFKNDII